MALQMAGRSVVVLLAMLFCLDVQGHAQLVDVDIEDASSSSLIHARRKREASQNVSDYLLQVTLTPSGLEYLQTVLKTLSFPVMINNVTEIHSINTTTVCTQTVSGYECRCQQPYVWPGEICLAYGACDSIVGGTCGCIKGLPPGGQLCRLNDFQPVSADLDVDIEVRFPLSTVPAADLFNNLRQILKVLPLPQDITASVRVVDVVFTTGCYSSMAGALQCHCEEAFFWSCDQCEAYGACNSSRVGEPCQCINQLPTDGQLCRANITHCLSTTSESIITTTMTTMALTAATTAPTPAVSTSTMTPSTTAMTSTGTTSTPALTTTTTTTTTTPSTTMSLTETTPALTATTKTTTPSTTMSLTETTALTATTKTTTPSTMSLTETTTAPTTTASTSTAMASVATTVALTTRAASKTRTTTTTTLTTTTTTTALTTTTATTATPIIEEKPLSFTMDLNFDPSFNSPSNELYQYVLSVVRSECDRHIPGLQDVEIKEFRPGSTVVDYIVKATYIQDVEIIAAETGIFNKLAENYSMIFDNLTPLQFEPREVFFGKSVTLTCDPPPSTLGFGSNTKAEWRLNGLLIREDELHRFSTRNGAAILTISNFFVTDNGNYECKLTDSSLSLNIVVRQKSAGPFTLKSTPLIQVTPVRQQVRCEVGREVLLKCSVSLPYTVVFKDIPAAGEGSEISHRFSIPSCENTRQTFVCQEKNFVEYSEEIQLVLSTQNFVCTNDSVFGDGMVDDEAAGPCEPNKVGEQVAVCRATGIWELLRDGCILKPIQELLGQSQNLNNNSLPVFVEQLRTVTVNFVKDVVESTPTIIAIVDIFSNIGKRILLLIPITKTSMEDLLITTGILTIDDAKESWDFINSNDTKRMIDTKINISEAESVSSNLLTSLEILTSGLSDDSLNIHTPFIILNKTTFSNNFAADFNSSVQIEIPAAGPETKSLTVMTFDSMDNVLPPRDKVNSSVTVINGKVVLVQSNGNIKNVSLGFDIQNDTLGSPQCVFWNFTLFDRLGGWDSKGCEVTGFINGTVTCNCNHLTSFSILMSPFSLNIPALDYITFIGVGISMASLVICIIIEGVIWNKISRNNTSYLRHVSIVNIAVSLLIADIWFIIGAAISSTEETNISACMAATFFIHFFYLALFFWMLASALLLLYRTVSVFDDGLSKQSMLAIGFSLGYGAPLLIAVITIAVTAPSERYIRATGVCWLNWEESKALLAFVIPALLIVVINLVILLVVLYKILRRRAVGDAAHAEERHVLVVIARALAVLTPFFGLTWGLGVGTMVSPFNEGIHIAFAFFNSLQGFFILLFGTLLDKKVRSEIAIKSQSSKSGTRSTSAGTASSGGLGFLRNWRRGRDGYNISSTSGGSNRFSNT